MNILILNYEYPPLGGGAGVVSRYHAEGLSKKEYSVTVLTAWFEGEKEVEISGNLKVIKLKSKRKYTYKSTPDEWLSWIKKSKLFLKEYLKKNKFDYCFAHFALPGGEVAKYINKKFKIPFAVISHGQDIPWFFPKQMFKYHLVTYFWIKHICTHADKLILLTKAMKKNADRFMRGQKNKNYIIPNGCNTKIFLPDYSKRTDKLKILFIGRMVAQKDPFTFLKAITLLKEEIGNNFSVSILGDGPMRKKMEKYAGDQRLNDVISFKGWVTKDVMLHEYQSAHLQVISSKAEAMSIAALESLCSGLYVISTPVSGNTDLIKKGVNGNLFRFCNKNDLYEKVLFFYKEKFKKQYTISENFLNDFRKKYDWSNIVNKLADILPENIAQNEKIQIF